MYSTGRVDSVELDSRESPNFCDNLSNLGTPPRMIFITDQA